ncbi:MAG: hypothetical protein Q4C73_02260 [Eubacteriales bacterium]|nr:hypothetical protein [Eubacteriales bacterium]
MRKIQKVLTGVFLTGILLAGIGTGMAVGEYSSMDYMGEQLLGGDQMVTENFDYAFDPKLGDIGVVPVWYDGCTAEQLELDSSVPENVTRYEVTYSPELVEPGLILQSHSEYREEDAYDFEREEENEENPPDSRRIQGDLFLETWYAGDGSIWLKEKDTILNELKNNRFASWRVRSIADVVIKVNPASRDCVIVR